MINLKVDEAYAFDYLAILEVKKNLNSQSEVNWQECLNYMMSQLPEDKKKIVNSEEYLDLVEANKKVFFAVEQARYGTITAKEVDTLNLDRYKCKIKLQEKFFANKLTEQKT